MPVNWSEEIEPDTPVMDEPLVWPPGPPRPHPFRRVAYCAGLTTGLAVGGVALLLQMRGLLTTMSWPCFFASVAASATFLTAIGRHLHGRLNPGIDDLTSHELLIWSFWVTLLTLPATLVLLGASCYLLSA